MVLPGTFDITEIHAIFILGRVIDSMRQINWLLGRNPNTAWVQRWLPNFIKMPFWMFALRGSKF